MARGNRILHSGIGLFSICERLAAPGGDMAMESAPDDGTRIWLTVPLAPVNHANPTTDTGPRSALSLFRIR